MRSVDNVKHVSEESRRSRLGLKIVGITVVCVVTLCLFLLRSDGKGAYVNTLTKLENGPDSMSSISGDCSEMSVKAYASDGKYYLSDTLFNGNETYTRRTEDPRFIYWTGTQWVVAKSVGASGWFATCSAARLKDCKSGIEVTTCKPETCAGYELMSPSQPCAKKGYALATTNSQTCHKLGGASNGGYTDCHFNLCTRTNGDSAHGFGLGSESDCAGDSSASYYLIVKTIASECSSAGGAYDGNPSDTTWINCYFYVCKKGRYYPAAVGSCPSNQKKKFYGIVSATTDDCNKMGGRYNGNPGLNDWTSCHLDFCDAKC